MNLSKFSGLLGLRMEFEPYNPNLWPMGQKLLPSKSFQVAGIPYTSSESLPGLPYTMSEFLSSWIKYKPDPYFNSDFMGTEAFSFTINDQCNFNPAVAAGAACVSPNIQTFVYNIKVHAVNNRPLITLDHPFFNVTEDQNQTIMGISVDDVDLNEIRCAVEPCTTGKGVLQIRIATMNGTIQVSPSLRAKAILFETFLTAAFGTVAGFTTNRDERICIMQLSCSQYGSLLTLADDSVQTICESSGVDSIRCKEVLQYCTTASLALIRFSNDECISILSTSDLYKVRISCSFHQKCKPKIIVDDSRISSRMFNTSKLEACWAQLQ